MNKERREALIGRKPDIATAPATTSNSVPDSTAAMQQLTAILVFLPFIFLANGEPSAWLTTMYDLNDTILEQWILNIFPNDLSGLCNGIKDMPDELEESFNICRRVPCPDGMFSCNYGACVPPAALCDGKEDCVDASDEKHLSCLNATNKLDAPTNTSCNDEFACHSEDQCLELDLICNGVKECEDGSDETLEVCGENSCGPEQFRCSYGGCVEGGAFCDQYVDCADASDEPDERMCMSNEVQVTYVQCSSGNTLPIYQMCDGVVNCPDKSDEVSQHKCNNYRKCTLDVLESNNPAERGRLDCSLPDCKEEGAMIITGSLVRMHCEELVESENLIYMTINYSYCYNGDWHQVSEPDCTRHEPQQIVWDEGKPLTLKCPLEDTSGNLRWMKGDETVYNAENLTMPGYSTTDQGWTLVILQPVPEDESVYSCIDNIMHTISKLSVKVSARKSGSVGTTVLIAIMSVILAACILLIIMYLIWKRRERRIREELLGLRNDKNVNKDMPLDQQTDYLPYDKKWEFPRALLELGAQLGSGAFGVVMKGEAKGIVRGEAITTVAVKMVKADAGKVAIKALVSELKIMIHLGRHVNIVNLLGACTKSIARGELFVISEYCPIGNLHDYLVSIRDKFRNTVDNAADQPKYANADQHQYVSNTTNDSHQSQYVNNDGQSQYVNNDGQSQYVNSDGRSQYVNNDDQPHYVNTSEQTENGETTWSYNIKGENGSEEECVGTTDLHCWAFQIARGMEYLSGKKVIHGDLATRNILLTKDNIVKICDFGLAKSLYNNPEYHKTGDAPVPLKWLAIESVEDCVFSTQSDVWSFGVTLWEIFSLGMTPYPGLATFQEILTQLKSGYRMGKPRYSDDNLYNIMVTCWYAEPHSRPTFSALVCSLGNLMESGVRDHYIQINDTYQQAETNSKVVDDGYLMPVTTRYINVPRHSSIVTQEAHTAL